MISLRLNHNLNIQNFVTSYVHEKCSKQPNNCLKGFCIKLTKICKENQGWNVLYIHGYDVTDAEFKTL